MEKLPASFFERKDVVKIARELLGKVLITQFDGEITSGSITETEAYNGVIDKASHAYNGRRTRRTEVMFGEPGMAYVYLCYGIHHLFNVVTNVKDVPHAVLIRSIQPLEGIPIMLERMNRSKPYAAFGKGPGNVSRSLGIHTMHTGSSLQGDEIFIASDNFKVKPAQIEVSKRIGIDYAGEDALLPYRFVLKL